MAGASFAAILLAGIALAQGPSFTEAAGDSQAAGGGRAESSRLPTAGSDDKFAHQLSLMKAATGLSLTGLLHSKEQP
jgi:hypothetical protein